MEFSDVKWQRGEVRYGVLCDMVLDIRLDSIVYGDTQNEASCNV